MANISLNELRLMVAEILDEAKKKKDKAKDLKKKGASIEAYGLYDEVFDFSAPLGAANLYRQQGAVNWGPQTSDGPHIDSRFAEPNLPSTHLKEHEEAAIRSVVREVIENGLVPASSAWAPLTERATAPVAESPWHEAESLLEAWYDRFKDAKKSGKDAKPKGKGYEKTSYGDVKSHGEPKSSKKSSGK